MPIPPRVAKTTEGIMKRREVTSVAIRWFLIFAILSIALFLQASKVPDVPKALFWVAGGLAAGVAALISIERQVTGAAVKARGIKAWAGAGLVLLGVILVAVALVAVRDLAEGPVLPGNWLAMGLAMIGVASAIVGALFLDKQLDEGSIGASFWLTIAGLALLILASLVLSGTLFAATAGFRLAAFAAAVIGFVMFKIGMPDQLDRIRSERARLWLTGGPGVLAVIAGIAFLLLASGSDSGLLVVGGIGFFGFGLTLLAECGLRFTEGRSGERRRFLAVGTGLGGLGLLAIGLFVAPASLGEWRSMITVLLLATVLTGAFFVLRGEGLFVALLLGFILVWSLHDRTPLSVTELADDGPLVLVLGDSFSAGQGSFEFYENNNSKLATDSTREESPCRRAPSAHGEVLAGLLEPVGEASGRRPWGVVNLACSGAKAKDIHQTGQHAQGPGSTSQLEQLAALPEAVKQRIELVDLSIGGNDAGFADVAVSCLLPADCSTNSSYWLHRAQSLGPQVGDDLSRSPSPTRDDELSVMFEAIRLSVGALDGTAPTGDLGWDIPTVVVPYPQVLDNTNCKLAVSDDEQTFVVNFERVLNGAVVRAAFGAGALPFPGAFGAYRPDDAGNGGRLLCSETPGVNFVHLLPHEGSLVGRLNPQHWKDGSLHPRAEGHRRMADRLLPWVESGLGRAGRGETFYDYRPEDFADLCQVFPWTTDQPTTSDGCADVIGTIDPPAESLDPDEWVLDRLFETVDEVAPPLVALMAAGALLALALYELTDRTPRWLFPKPRTSPPGSVAGPEADAERTNIEPTETAAGTETPDDGPIVSGQTVESGGQQV